jgi:hypothetical protein
MGDEGGEQTAHVGTNGPLLGGVIECTDGVVGVDQKLNPKS